MAVEVLRTAVRRENILSTSMRQLRDRELKKGTGGRTDDGGEERGEGGGRVMKDPVERGGGGRGGSGGERIERTSQTKLKGKKTKWRREDSALSQPHRLKVDSTPTI